MKTNIYFLLLSILFLLNSCDSQSPEEIVEAFAEYLKYEDAEKVIEIYPKSAPILQHYYKLDSLEIERIDKGKGQTKVYCKTNFKTMIFVVGTYEGKMKIIDSYGLSAYKDEPISKYCEKIGCFSYNATDEEIAINCELKKIEYSIYLEIFRRKLSSKFIVANHTVDNYYGFVSGDVTILNNSNIKLPMGSYKLYINFLDNKENIIFTTEKTTEPYIYDFLPSQSMSVYVNEKAKRNMKYISVAVEIIDEKLLGNAMISYITGTNCEGELQYD